MRGWGIRIQVGATHFQVIAWPFDWEWERSLMAPKRWGGGIWIVKDVWR